MKGKLTKMIEEDNVKISQRKGIGYYMANAIAAGAMIYGGWKTYDTMTPNQNIKIQYVTPVSTDKSPKKIYDTYDKDYDLVNTEKIKEENYSTLEKSEDEKKDVKNESNSHWADPFFNALENRIDNFNKAVRTSGGILIEEGIFGDNDKKAR